MKKRDFEKWALTQPDFKMWEGTLYFFGFKFWDLEKEIVKPLIQKFKNDIRQTDIC